MPLLLVAARELPPAGLAREGFLARVGPDVGGEVVRPAEGPHADAALERLLARVDADVPGEFVAAREPAVAAVDGTRVGTLVQGGLGGTVGVLARLHGKELQRHVATLVRLTQYFVTLEREEENNPLEVLV